MRNFKPMLLTDLKQYDKKKFVSDLIAGIIVAVIALPLSIALAIASGVSPEAGIYTAIIAGFLTAALGGSNVQIAGPTAAFATIVAGIVAKSGMDGLIIATILAGIFLVIMGLLKLGNLIRFIPFTITTGFTAGIAVTLVVGQLKDFFGVTYQNGTKPIETMEKVEAFFQNASTINGEALVLGLICLGILFLWPKVTDKIPSSLVAVIAGIAICQIFKMNVNTIGDLYTVSNKLPAFTLPKITNFSAIVAMIPDAITIALLAGIESLLSCVVADGMINKRHRSNTELIAQGVANVGSALFGGIPATGAIARTAANIKNGGNTPISGIVHSVVLLLVLVVLMPYASLIPMPAIAAILIHVAYNMCGWKQFVHLVKTSPKSDTIVLVMTFALTIVFDLVVAIEIGIITVCVLFMKRLSEESNIQGWKYIQQDDTDVTGLMDVPKHISVYELNGPLFFAVASQIQTIQVKKYTKCVILRMRSVPSIDTDAIRNFEKLVKSCQRCGITVIFSHVNEQPMRAMEKAGLVAMVGEENFCDNIEASMERAMTLGE